MENIGLHEIRSRFLEFFREKEHFVQKSYPLVPKNDKSLLLINAGMAPLKPYFLGTEEPPSKRMATSQKCVRTGDIENVGKTARHATFFEMLGSFSFGDYFKKEAIAWAWEFMTEKMGIPVEDLWVSVYLEDDEAFNIWNRDVGVSSDRIVRLGKEDNFWELEVGPCGPCSEIYIDRGAEYGCSNPDCKPGCDCDRYIEVWNLVFSQYDKDENGNYNLLEKPNIDTGMGLERIAAVLQKTDNIFEIDVMKSLISWVEARSGKTYKRDEKEGLSFRVIADHIRAVTFLVGDGVIPSNEGRGYVLRRLIRRASRHGKLLGINENFLKDLVAEVIESWKVEYDELVEKQSQIVKIVEIEEEKFQETIDQGIDILDSYMEEMVSNGQTELSGEKSFKLYDTYGFPLDLTKEILEEKGYSVDEAGFSSEMEAQRDRARKAREEADTAGWNKEGKADFSLDTEVEFKGYDSLSIESRVLAVYVDSKKVESISEGQEGIIVLEQTPFYPEGGGQVGDKGFMTSEGTTVKVLDTRKEGDVIFHIVKVLEGTVAIRDMVSADVNKKSRMDTARNHSVTHILHQALKDVLGEHVNQAGSLVMPERMRFDFTHFEPVKKEELEKIEDIVNEQILSALDVVVEETSIDEARARGAQALFGEKYGETVRLVEIGDYSKELCGGTHIGNSSQIGMFKVVSEGGIASGTRRIEAVTGSEAYKYFKEQSETVDSVAQVLKANKKDIVTKAQNLSEEVRSLEKELNKLKSELALGNVDDIIKEKTSLGDVALVAKRLESVDADGLRDIADEIKSKLGSVVVVLSAVNDGKIVFTAMATKDLVKRGVHAGNILKEIAKMTGGGGGGRPDMAQAGGKDSEKLDEAMAAVSAIVESQLS